MSIEIALVICMNNKGTRRVLIYDEAGFSRVCSALLEMSGCATDIMGDSSGKLNSTDVGVFVTSYPYGAFLLDEVRKRSIPMIVLFDNFDQGFVDMLQSHDNLYCMIKPLDYDRFKGLVRQLLNGEQVSREGFSIL